MKDMVLEMNFSEWKDFTKEGGSWKNPSRWREIALKG